MKQILIALITFHFLITAVRSIARREFLTFHTVIDFFLYIPLLLYFLELSEYVTSPTDCRFYTILIVFTVAAIIDELLFYKYFISVGFPRYSVKSPLPVIDFLNGLYIAALFLENILLSGSLFPVEDGVDIHAESVHGLGFLTRSLYAFISMDFLAYYVTRKLRFLFWVFVILAFPIMTRHARLAASIALLQFMFLFFFVVRRKIVLFFHNMPLKRRIIFAITLVASLAIAFISVSKAALISNVRLSEMSGCDFSYCNESRFDVDTGNETMNEVAAIVYGYSPFSFDNLHNGIVECPSDVHNYWGKHSLRSLTCGILRLHNLFGFSPYEPDAFATDVSLRYHDGKGFSNVPTMFFDFFYDFGMFCIFPIAGLVFFARYLTNFKYRENTLFANLLFCYFIPLFAFATFQNLVFQSHGFVEVFIFWMMIRYVFCEESKK